MYRMRASAFCMTLVFLFSCQVTAETQGLSCRDWASQVDASVEPRARFDPLTLPDDEKLAGVRCLLSVQGNRGRARFGGATAAYVSQIYPEGTTEVAALFYISYIFTERWDHSSGVALRGHNGRMNDPKDIALAYKKYRSWYKRVLARGWKKSQELGTLPLANSSVSWG
jgi:hypothetical protein